ncbi:hypothetical protein DFP73DRAFT_263900 [Morchella snyderi]|nr:hypothetical protein DFP73DRAFT_263900 [Morchella snyderi]
MTTYIQEKFARVWESPSKVGHELNEWVEHVLGILVVDVLFSSKSTNEQDWTARLKKLSPRESFRASRQSLDNRRKGAMEVDAGAGAEEVDLKRRKEDLESWKKIAIGRLGRLRVGELFDIVVEWPDSLGGVEDLKSYITSPPTRLHLTTTFTSALSSRLLHPAAATSDILRAYISLIRAFTVLDPRGVLLDRVSRGIRRYLRDRDDTVRVIVRGIMSESLPPGEGDPEELGELSKELGRGIPALMAQQGGGLEELDYDDMTWAPDPVDAGPEFRRSKGLDVVGSLISLWDSKEVWTKEIQAVLSSSLLGTDGWTFEKEIRTVELLKLRFGETAMQGCDVMLKDISDSKRSNTAIRINEELGPPESTDVGLEKVQLHAKILSRLFWPAMKEGEFKVPEEIETLQRRYEHGFENLKSKRKLTWLHSMGIVDVELELADRIVRVPDAATWQAAVIYEFDEDKGGATWSIKDIAERLDMEESLAKRAVSFWCSKDVLRDSGDGVFVVVENLAEYEEILGRQQEADGSEAMRGTAGGVEDEEISEEKKKEQKTVEQFIVGLLTNQGATSAEQIGTILGMFLPGFNWGVDELSDFLNMMRTGGKLDYENGSWKIASA